MLDLPTGSVTELTGCINESGTPHSGRRGRSESARSGVHTLLLAGKTVQSAPGGQEALVLLSGQPFSLVVSDVRMMPMDGITLLKIRQQWPHLPVVLMTAYADVDRAVEAMRAGACDFLLKPFEPQALLAHVEKYKLRRRRMMPASCRATTPAGTCFRWRRGWRRPMRRCS